MKKLFLSILLIGSSMVALHAENNNTPKETKNIENKTKKSNENNESIKAKRAEQQIQAQMKREEKYAKEKTFYKGKDYDLSGSEVDPSSLDSIPLIEPDYSFNMDDVYD